MQSIAVFLLYVKKNQQCFSSVVTFEMFAEVLLIERLQGCFMRDVISDYDPTMWDHTKGIIQWVHLDTWKYQG